MATRTRRLVVGVVFMVTMGLVPFAPDAVAAAGTCHGRTVTIAGAGTINGTNGADVILGSSQGDTINGFWGMDAICGGGGPDTIDAGDGNDDIYGDGPTDTLRGGPGTDFIFGGPR